MAGFRVDERVVVGGIDLPLDDGARGVQGFPGRAETLWHAAQRITALNKRLCDELAARRRAPGRAPPRQSGPDGLCSSMGWTDRLARNGAAGLACGKRYSLDGRQGRLVALRPALCGFRLAPGIPRYEGCGKRDLPAFRRAGRSGVHGIGNRSCSTMPGSSRTCTARGQFTAR